MLWTVNLEGGPKVVNNAAVALDDYIYSFGGHCCGVIYKLYGQIVVYRLNTNTLRWAVLPPQCDMSGTMVEYPEVPYNRSGHTTVAYNRKIYLWGGRCPVNFCAILYCFDPKTGSWSRPKVTGTIPTARDAHSACVSGKFMYVFGGFLDGLRHLSNDLYALNLETFEWMCVKTLGHPPSCRHLHAAVAVNNRMYIFGGRSVKQVTNLRLVEVYCNKILYLDLETKRWHQITTFGDEPFGRRCHSMVICNKMIYVFGGYNGILNRFFDTVISFDTEKNQWTQIRPHGKSPAGRKRHAAVLMDTRMFVFGGTNRKTSYGMIEYSDTHVLDIFPSLKTLSMLATLKYKLDSSSLPNSVCQEMIAMTMPNKIMCERIFHL